MKILIADDSAITRGIFEKAFKENGCEVVSVVSNGRKAVDFCRENKVDLVVSDYDMPEMNGIEAAAILTKKLGVSVVIYSDDMKIRPEAASAGASVIHKPSLASYNASSMNDFVDKVVFLSGKDGQSANAGSAQKKAIDSVDHDDFSVSDDSGGRFKILCIGASTGGPTAVQEVVSGLGENFPLPILYAQHLDVGADEKMAKWFTATCPNIPVTLAKEGELAEAGHVYLAPADTHLVIGYVKNGLPVLHLSDEPPERFLRPAVNKLFRSAAKHYGESCLALLMTGMGRDGAEGCKKIVEAGGFTIAEDKSTCTVFGMPAAAIEMNAAKKVLPRNEVASAILKMVK